MVEQRIHVATPPDLPCSCRCTLSEAVSFLANVSTWVDPTLSARNYIGRTEVMLRFLREGLEFFSSLGLLDEELLHRTKYNLLFWTALRTHLPKDNSRNSVHSKPFAIECSVDFAFKMFEIV